MGFTLTIATTVDKFVALFCSWIEIEWWKHGTTWASFRQQSTFDWSVGIDQDDHRTGNQNECCKHRIHIVSLISERKINDRCSFYIRTKYDERIGGNRMKCGVDIWWIMYIYVDQYGYGLVISFEYKIEYLMMVLIK